MVINSCLVGGAAVTLAAPASLRLHHRCQKVQTAIRCPTWQTAAACYAGWVTPEDLVEKVNGAVETGTGYLDKLFGGEEVRRQSGDRTSLSIRQDDLARSPPTQAPVEKISQSLAARFKRPPVLYVVDPAARLPPAGAQHAPRSAARASRKPAGASAARLRPRQR